MSRDKVTVDEPLISTDVDSLIRVIAEKKKIPLNELRQNSTIDKKTLDKWIAVLEDEGYITVEYGIRGTFINWRDIEEVPKEEKTFRTEGSNSQIHPEPTETVFSESEKPQEEDFSAEVPVEEEPEPEELLSAYLAKKKPGYSDEGTESLKSSILTSLEEEKDVKITPPPADEPEEPEETQMKENEEEPVEVSEEVKEAEKPVVMPSRAPSMKLKSAEKVPAADVRELMNSYLSEINKEKAKIEVLKKDRENLYREKFVTMEGKMQADIVVLTEKILEKQTKIAELKEHVLELPDKVEELSKLQDQMENLRSESREALSRTKSKAEEFLASVEKSKTEVSGKVADIDTIIESQNGNMRELEKLSAALNGRSSKLKDALSDARTQLGELTSSIDALDSDLQKVEESKEQIAEMTDSLKGTISAHGTELESLEHELEDISKIEQWVQEYVRDYERKVDDIEHYVSKSEDELGELKEAAEELYLKKYLGELETLTDSYDNELHDAAAHEKDIDQKIAESRVRIADLVKESQDMVKKLKGEVPQMPEKDYGILVARVKAKTQRTKNVIEEKQQERAKLLDDSRKARKTSPPSKKPQARPVVKKTPAKAMPAKKKRK